jgi:8-oxo-dGTP pyrophosphatase MutT (NUDIX family)
MWVDVLRAAGPASSSATITRVKARPAATVIVARPSEDGVEVLALRRANRSRFGPGFVVFPGGVIEPEDAALATRLFGDRQEAARACAFRELYEEAGFLLTASGPVGLPTRPPLEELVFEPPPLGALPEVARWVAPEFLEVRFDARFYATGAPRGIEPVVDGMEIDRAWWAPPFEVLDAAERGDDPLMWPTFVTLGALASCGSVDDVLRLRVDQVPRPR